MTVKEPAILPMVPTPVSADNDPLIQWLLLKQVPGIGNRMFKHLVDRFGEPSRVLSATRSQLLSVEGISGKLADGILAAHRFLESACVEFEAVKKKGYRLIAQSDPEYPPLLPEIPDPPPMLYAHGLPLSHLPAVAIVGSRYPTRYGISMAHRLGADLAARGIVVVSGMARGIDTAAHQGALSNGGRTIAVLGSGLSVIYPPENAALYHHIAESGTVLSELPVSEPPASYHFPARNRIISGMTLGTVVVEAAKKSGSLITARLAAEQNREVFAVPGNINSFTSTGAHNLLKQGAKLVACVDDILEELTYLIQPASSRLQQESIEPEGKNILPCLTSEESEVYYSLDPYPAHIDEVARRLSKDTASVSVILLRLELKGVVSQMPGKYFCVSGE